MKRRVLVAGEGKTELGGWAGHPSYRAAAPLPGVLEALLSKAAPDGWTVVAACEWKLLPRYRANEPKLEKDELNTRALWLHARDHGCDLIAFSRDRDRFESRAQAVERGAAWLSQRCQTSGIRVIGGMAQECTEAWLLALLGEARSEELHPASAKERLREAGVVGTVEMVDRVHAADVGVVPADARSLRKWLAAAEAAMRS